MTETPRPSQQQNPASERPQPRHAQPAGDASEHRGESVPDVFGDGSTREQRERIEKEAQEVNDSIHAAADAERKAREDQSG
jgi:hypothetical protein